VHTASVVPGEHGAVAHHTMQGRLQMLKHMVYTRHDLAVTSSWQLAAQTQVHNDSKSTTDNKNSSV